MTPLLLAEKPKPPSALEMMDVQYRPKSDSKEEVVAALRELMHLGPNDPAPVPPPAAVPTGKKEGGDKDKKEAKNIPETAAAISEQ